MDFRLTEEASCCDAAEKAHRGQHCQCSRKLPDARRIGPAVIAASLSLLFLTGCYVPLCSHGIPASSLPDSFRTPTRSVAAPLNLVSLNFTAPDDYLLGAHDVIDINVSGMSDNRPQDLIRARITHDGIVNLPLVGEVPVAGMNLAEAQRAIQRAFEDGFVVKPRVSIDHVEKQTIDVSVIGEVTTPGIYPLPRFQNHVGHALALAGGLGEQSGNVIELHRRISRTELQGRISGAAELAADRSGSARTVSLARPVLRGIIPCTQSSAATSLSDGDQKSSYGRQHTVPSDQRAANQGAGSDERFAEDLVEAQLHICLRGGHVHLTVEGQTIPLTGLTPNDVTLRAGDVVLVPRKRDDVFFVTGPLNRTNVVNFTVRERDRELGNAFLIPSDRDIDVVTAVAMAGYIDPIDSPSTVTVHRTTPCRPPLLIRVDLMKARDDWRENLYVQAGDIIYLNPDSAWWFRRTLDRVLPTLITSPYSEAMGGWLNPRRVN